VIYDSVSSCTHTRVCVCVCVCVCACVCVCVSCACSSGDLFDKKFDDPTQLIATLRATQLVGIVSLMYGVLMHTDAPARTDTPPPSLPPSTVAVVRSAFNMLNHIARLYLPLLQVCCMPLCFVVTNCTACVLI